MSRWFVYLVLCQDRSLYCGIANNIERRIAEHNAGTGAKYIVPARRPVKCAWKRAVNGKSTALKLEYWIKRRDSATKTAIVQGATRIVITRTGEFKLVQP
ncbi:MAG TPA: hypothetical protein DCQ83_01245 [Fibrobacteres bacterium]|jgi:putative endonuclease|nr:hypothetical protein [Fibrobacterota bacterium]